MNWKKIRNRSELPKDGRPFIAFFKGRICLANYEKEECRYYVVWDPAEYGQGMQLSQDRENKIRLIVELPQEAHPFDLEAEVKNEVV